jgi:DNA-binding protein H-NS
MAIDIKALNQRQLEELIEKAERRKQEVAQERLEKTRRKIELLLESEQLTFEDVFGAQRRAHRSMTLNRRKGSRPRRKSA